MKAKLTRVTKEGKMRTQEMVGFCSLPPVVGEPFIILNEEPIDRTHGENMRSVSTSRVMWTQAQFEGGIAFQTESGTDYIFEELEEA